MSSKITALRFLSELSDIDIYEGIRCSISLEDDRQREDVWCSTSLNLNYGYHTNPDLTLGYMAFKVAFYPWTFLYILNLLVLLHNI